MPVFEFNVAWANLNLKSVKLIFLLAYLLAKSTQAIGYRLKLHIT